jgi:hypothetical protein
VLGYLYTGVFLHLSYERYFWTLMALAAVAAILVRQAAGADMEDDLKPAQTPDIGARRSWLARPIRSV